MSKLRPHIFSPIGQKLSIARIDGTGEQTRFGSTILAGFANSRNLPEQLRFDRLNMDELDRILFESTNQHLIPLSPASRVTENHATAAHKIPLVPGHRSN